MNNEEKVVLNLIKEANVSALWIQKTLRLKEHSPEIRSILRNMEDQYNIPSPFNPGLLIAMSYMFFVLPKEKFFDDLSLQDLELSSFNVIKGNKDNDTILRRVRNSLTHGNFTMVKNFFVFNDKYKNEEEYSFICSIDIVEFGNLINEMLERIKQLKY